MKKGMMEIMIEKEIVQLLNTFIQKARADPRIGLPHMTLYVALLCQWYSKKCEVPLYIFSHELQPLCKLAGSATYHRSIRQLNEYGYIQYVPSHNHFLGSLVYFTSIKQTASINSKKGFMKYFLLPDKNDWRIMKVPTEEVDVFKKKYMQEIMVEADSIANLLVLFTAKLEVLQE